MICRTVSGRFTEVNINHIIFIQIRLVLFASGDLQIFKSLFGVRRFPQKGSYHVSHDRLYKAAEPCDTIKTLLCTQGREKFFEQFWFVNEGSSRYHGFVRLKRYLAVQKHSHKIAPSLRIWLISHNGSLIIIMLFWGWQGVHDYSKGRNIACFCSLNSFL